MARVAWPRREESPHHNPPPMSEAGAAVAATPIGGLLESTPYDESRSCRFGAGLYPSGVRRKFIPTEHIDSPTRRRVQAGCRVLAGRREWHRHPRPAGACTRRSAGPRVCTRTPHGRSRSARDPGTLSMPRHGSVVCVGPGRDPASGVHTRRTAARRGGRSDRGRPTRIPDLMSRLPHQDIRCGTRRGYPTANTHTRARRG